MKEIYLLYDARYPSERATVYCVADTLQEAKEDKEEMFNDAIIVKCDVNGTELINPVVI